MKKMWNLMMAILTILVSLPKKYLRAAGECGEFVKERTVAASTGLHNRVYDAVITVTQSASGTFAAAIQLNGVNDKALTVAGAVGFYLSTDSAGQVLATTSTDVTSLAIGTDGLCMEDNVSGNVWGRLVSEADGDIDLAIVVPNGKTVYLNLIMPDGTIIISDAMTYGM